MKKKLQSVLIAILTVILISIRYIEYKRIPINLPLTTIRDITILTLVVTVLLKKND